MPWWTIYRTSDGRALGHTSLLPDSLPAGLASVEHVTRQDQGTMLWNSAALTWSVPRPPAPPKVDRLSDLAAHPFLSAVWTRLTTAQRTQMRKALVWVLAGRRFREQAEEVSVDPPDGWPTDPAQAVE